MTAPPRRFRIDEVRITLRGADPAAADAALSELAPALRRQLAPGPAGEPRTLADRIAQQIAHQIPKG